MALLTDDEIATIRRKLNAGWGGPWLVTTAKRLLDDVEERRRIERAAAQTWRPTLPIPRQPAARMPMTLPFARRRDG